MLSCSVRFSNCSSRALRSSVFILVLALASWMLFHTSWITWCCAVVIWLAGTCLVALNLLLVDDMGIMEILHQHHFLAGHRLCRRWGSFGPNPDGQPFVQSVKGSEMEGVFLPRFGDVGLERAHDVDGDEGVATWEYPVGTELLLYPFIGGELAQALGALPAVFDREEPQVTVPLAQHKVVCLPYLFWGGSEGGEGVGKARVGEFPDNAVEAAFVVADGGHLGRMGVDLIVPGRHVVVLGGG